ncbi:BCS1 N terminal-domain-containing protein [Aspergillus pseudoustus]|uniref:BCS1 N terminal-domain-containing protein n=1 Tax=Aspergillus pseudoustus TaxID=1810923 RepID=A0ABR4IJJ5_9EURO
MPYGDIPLISRDRQQLDSSSSFLYLSYFALASDIAQIVVEHYGNLLLEQLYPSIEVQSHDDVYNYLLYWLAKQRFHETNNRLIASASLASGPTVFGDPSTDAKTNDFRDMNELDETIWKASLANSRYLLWSPADRTHWLSYRHRYLVLTRELEESRSTIYSRTEKLRILCPGWNASILKKLLLEARVAYSQKEQGKTGIYRAAKRAYENSRRDPGLSTWDKYSPREAISDVASWVEKTFPERGETNDAQLTEAKAERKERAKCEKNLDKDDGEGSSSSESDSGGEPSSNDQDNDKDHLERV